MESSIKSTLEIFVGEWVIFLINKTPLLGLVLNFIYLKGSARQKQYSLDYAPVNFKAKDEVKPRGIGVIGTWYTWDEDGEIRKSLNFKEAFVKIENYKTTLRKSPLFESGRLIFHSNQLQEIKKLQLGN